MRYVIALSFIFLHLISVARDQSQKIIDSLWQDLASVKHDTTKINLLNEIAFTYAGVDLKQAQMYAKQALILSEKTKWSKGIAVSARYLGAMYTEAGERKTAEPYLLQSLKESRAVHDFEGQVLSLYNLGNIYQHEGDYVKAAEYYFEGIRLSTEHGFEGNIALGNYYAAILFAAQGDYNKTTQYANKALSVARKLKDHYYTGTILEIIGYNYVKQQNYPRAIAAFEDAIKSYDTANYTTGKAKILSSMVACYPENPAIQLHYINLSDKAWASVGAENTLYALSNIANKGAAYYKMWKQPALIPDTLNLSRAQLAMLSDQYLKKGIDLLEKNNYREPLIDLYKSYSELLKDRGYYKEALVYYTKFSTLKDSVYSQENKNKLAYVESQGAIEARDKQIKINTLALSNARRTRIALISGSILLFVIGGLLFYQNQARRKTNTTLLMLNSELDEANKVKTKFFGILSHDLRSPLANLINFLHLQKEAPELLDKERVTQHQKQLTESAENLLETMETMLLWSKSQMEHFTPQKKRVDVADLFDYIRKQIPQTSNIRLSFFNPKKLSVSTDEDYLKTIMYNLTANAVKALMNTKDPSIEWKAAQNGSRVVLTITDNGPGVHKEQLDALYNEHAVVGARHGLGLHLIRDLAKAIQCRIQFEPDAGAGARFTLLV